MPKLQSQKKKTWKQGWYVVRNPSKYVGDVNKVRFMSSWEYEFDVFLDNNPNIMQWSSEPFPIPYVHPFKRTKQGHPKTANYLPDYWIKYKDSHGNIRTKLVEVKPLKETRVTRSKNPNQRIREQATFEINKAKWIAAKAMCDQQGWEWEILTERNLYK